MLPLPLGQAIRHHGKDGILVCIHGTQAPGTCGTMSGVMAYGGSAEFDVVWSDGTQSKQVPEALVRTSKAWEIVEGVVGTAEDIATAIQFYDTQSAVRRVEQSKAATSATSRRATDIARFIAENPALKPHTARNLKGEAYSGHALGAMNLKAQLTAQFPGTKFSVSSSSFAGGDSIDVSWTDGPVYEEVTAIRSLYSEGSFDGMTDSYEYASDRAWTDTFGGAKYVHGSRRFSDALKFSTATAICRKLGIEFTRYDQKPFTGEHEDLSHHAARCLHAVAVPTGCTEVTEVRFNTAVAAIEARFTPVFAQAAAPADAVADRRSAPKTETKVRTQVKRTASFSEKLTTIVDKTNARHTPPDGWEESDKVPRAEAVMTVESGKQESRKEAPPTVAVPTPWPSASSPRRLPADPGTANLALMAALKKVPATMLGYLAKQAGLPDGVGDSYHRSFTLWCQVESRSETDWRQAWAAFVAASDSAVHRATPMPPMPATATVAAAPVVVPTAKAHPLPHRHSVLPEVKAAPVEDLNEGDWVAYTNGHGIPCVGKVDRAWTVSSGGATRTEYFLVDAAGGVMTSPDYSKPITRTTTPAGPVAAEEDDDEPASVIAFPVAEISLVEMPPMAPVTEPSPVVGLGWLRRMRPAGQ